VTFSRTSRRELRRYFTEWYDAEFVNGLIDRDTHDQVARALPSYLPALVKDINGRGQAILNLGPKDLQITLREGRDPDKGRFNLFEIQWLRSKPRMKRTCFLGHRFTREISNSLRSNLRYVLEPSNINLKWSGIDLNAAGFFDEIIELIRKCDFCIFDNRLTEGRPNVYIEAGIAYALKRPFILANYKGNRLRLPADLKHITVIPYSNYQELAKRLYFSLPVFLKSIQ
jgi:glycosyltransferase involved in cell wall biosynthesis